MPTLRPTALLRQFRQGLHQEMFYLGLDVMHAQGNQLIAEGFVKLPSPLLKGTSCYQHTQADGSRIELHGACIAWVPAKPPGIIFLRGPRRMRIWNSTKPFVPGDHANPHLAQAPARTLFHLSKNIARWWLDYEELMRKRFSPDYRERCFQKFAQVPKAKSWKSPAEDLAWVRSYVETEVALAN